MDAWDLMEPVDVVAKLPENFYADLSDMSKKWLERKAALESLLQLIGNSDTPKLCPRANYNELIDTLRRVLEKDSNINVAATAAKCITAVAKGLRTKFAPHAPQLAGVVMEKFKEKRPMMRDPLIECIDAIQATTQLDAIAEDVLTAMGKPNPQIKQQVDAFLYRAFTAIRELPAGVPKKFVKEVAPVLVKHTADPDPEVRDAACSALGAMMRCVGPKAMAVFVGELSADKVKMARVEEFCTKAQQEAAEREREAAATANQGKSAQRSGTVGDEADSTSPHSAASSSTAAKKPPAAAGPKAPAAAVEVDVWEMLEPTDILPRLPDNFRVEVLENKKWLERKAALDLLHQLLMDNPRLCPRAHYADLVETLKQVLEKDSNINVASVAAKCLTAIAQGLRVKFAHYAPSLVSVVIEKFKEKRPVLRDPLIECLDAIYATTQLDVFADDVLASMGKPNPNVKIQVDLFLYRVFLHAKAAVVPKKFVKELVPALAKHTADPDPEVRDAACSALGAIMKCIGQKAATTLLGDVATDKAKMGKIEEFYNKAVAEAGQEEVTAMVQSVHKSDQQPTGNKQPSANAQRKPKPSGDEEGEDEEMESARQRKSLADGGESRPRKKPTKAQMMAAGNGGDDEEGVPHDYANGDGADSDETTSENKPLRPIGGKRKPSSQANNEADEDEEMGNNNGTSSQQQPDGGNKTKKRDRSSSQFNRSKAKEPPPPAESLLRPAPGERQNRARDERQLKLLKWNFDTPTEEHLQQLATLLTEASRAPLTAQLLSKDFKQHLKALEYLHEMLTTHADPQPLLDQVDLLLKWASVRFFDTNPAVLIKLLDFLLALFTWMESSGEQLLDTEMTFFVPYLLLKAGDPKDVVRAGVQRIVRVLGNISPPAKLFPLVLEGTKSKNSRQKAECLALADVYLEVVGVNITATPQVTMRALAVAISDRDSAVRNAALNAIVTVYKRIGDRVFTLVGKLNEKERAMMDERIRRSGKFVAGAPEAMNSSMVADYGGGGGRPATTAGKLNTTISGGTPLRARSSSAQRRPISMGVGVESSLPPGGTIDGTLTMPSNGGGGGGGGLGPSRRSMGALPNSNTKFQLDAKFFLNDLIDGVSATAASAASGGTTQRMAEQTAAIDLQPIRPVVRPSSHQRSSVGHFTRRSESVSSISSLENAEFIDRTVHNLSCLTLSVADEAIAQLLHLLHDPTNRHYLMERTDLILKTFVTQIFHIRSQHLEQLEQQLGGGAAKSQQPGGMDTLADGDTTTAAAGDHQQQPESELSEFMRSVCNFLSTMVKEDAIVQRIGADTMRSFIDAILALVSDERLTQVAGSRQIFRSLNVIVIRICEHSNPNNCFVSLMRLLIKYQAAEPDGRLIALIRKCLFKHVDVFLDPAKYEQLDLQVVFDLLHAYHAKFYVEPVGESVRETCRTLNVYIQRLIVTKRYKVLNYMHPYPESSHLVSYVRRCVRALGKGDAAKQQQQQLQNQQQPEQREANKPASTDATATPQQQQYNVIPDELVGLFRRAQEDIFDGCVEEIYNFMDVHPEQNGNFERLMTTSDYSCIIRRAFSEIRRQRIKKEAVSKAGDCVRMVLPDEDRDFLERQYRIQTLINDVLGDGGATAKQQQQAKAGKQEVKQPQQHASETELKNGGLIA